MALIQCPECGKEVSDQAASCPNCGNPLKQIHNGQPQMQPGGAQPNMNDRYRAQPVKKKGHGCLITVLVFIIFCAIMSIGVVSSTGGKKNAVTVDSPAASVEEESSAAPVEKKPALEVLSYDSTSDGYLRYVTGQIKNNTEKTYSYVQVTISLYKDETLVGSTLDNVNNLGPGETWEFKALITDDSSNKYKITDVTGY